MAETFAGEHLMRAIAHVHDSSRIITAKASPTTPSWPDTSAANQQGRTPTSPSYEPRVPPPLPSGLAMAAEESELEEQPLYALEIAQAPSRGRTCGFGDADRRALSAPLIARLRMHCPRTGREYAAEDMDISFLVVAADLRSANGTEEMNLVQHPSSGYLRGGSILETERYRQEQGDERFHYPPRTGSAAGRPVSREMTAENARMASSSYANRPDDARLRAYLDSGAVSHGRPRSNSSLTHGSLLPPSDPAHRISPPNGDFSFQAPRPSPPTHARRLPDNELETERKPSTGTSAYEKPSTAFSRISTATGLRPSTMSRARPSTGATSLSAAAHISGESLAGGRFDGEIACVKNLIGALTTNGHKLQAPGETFQGIFFVFHDLSVRTEGAFRIRLRLVSLGSPITGLHTGVSPVLAECLSPPFEVMSAKKFPGMLDPTPMSQSFAKQGLRIPTRRGANRKRRRGDGMPGREGSPMVEDEEEDYFY